jgi:hypothetical protein
METDTELADILLSWNKRTLLSAVIAGTLTALLAPLIAPEPLLAGLLGVMTYAWLAYYLWNPDEENSE